MATTPLQALYYPASSDAPNGPVQMQSLALSVESKLPMVFASAAARTAAFTAASLSPAAGMLSYRLDAGYWEYWNATAAQWRVFGAYRATTTLAASASVISLTGIPTYLRELRIAVTARGDTAANSVDIGVQVNTVNSASYRFRRRTLIAGTAGTLENLNSPYCYTGTIPANTAVAGVFGANVIEIIGWDSPHSGYLTIKGSGGYLDTGGHTIADSTGAASISGPYTSVQIAITAGNFVAGTQVSLTGWE